MPVIASIDTEQISSDGIGLIIPPPELRSKLKLCLEFSIFIKLIILTDIVDKTANFVARNGKIFETKIQEKEVSNKKFYFLRSDDIYNKYYLKKIHDFTENKNLLTSQEIAKKQQEIFKKLIVQEFKPDKPPKQFEFITDPPSLSLLDLNVVELTAQFVARNGKQFLTDLMNNEQKNPEFDFLRPQHILFPYFAKLLEQYTKILIPPRDLLKDLRAECTKEGIENVLNDVKYRAKYINYEKKQAQIEIEKIEKERLAYNSVDWHEFVVVEDINYEFNEIGNFPKPITPETLGSHLITVLRNEEDETSDVDMDIEAEKEIPNESSATKVQDLTEKVKETVNIPNDFTTDNVTIKKYDPKCIKKPFVASNKEEYLISPLTGEKILASKLSEHMRIGLLDPRWIEQRDKITERSKEQSVFDSGETVIDNLKQLAERRTDIFGKGDTETVIGKKIGEEEKNENPVIWDGHKISVASTTRAMNKNLSSNHVKDIPCPPKPFQNNEFKVPLPPPIRHPNYPMNIRDRLPLLVPPPLMMLPPRYSIPHVPFFRKFYSETIQIYFGASKP